MSNREKILEELAAMDNETLFNMMCSYQVSRVDDFLCADCHTVGHRCPEEDCDFVDEWMREPCRHGRLLEVRK